MILKDVSEPLLWWWYTFIVQLQLVGIRWLTLGFPALSLRSLTAEVRLEYPSTNHRGALACRSFYAVF
jgi:hypothetical protein